MFFFFQAEDGIRDHCVTGVQTCALPISPPEIDGAVATALVNDPGGGRATLGRSEGRVQVISAREKADERTRPRGSGGAEEGLGRRRIASGVFVVSGRRGVDGAVRGARRGIQFLDDEKG